MVLRDGVAGSLDGGEGVAVEGLDIARSDAVVEPRPPGARPVHGATELGQALLGQGRRDGGDVLVAGVDEYFEARGVGEVEDGLIVIRENICVRLLIMDVRRAVRPRG